jgi:hypothetical protein
MSSSGNNPRNPQKAPKISWKGLNLRKHLKFISETSKYAFVPSFTYFECQVLEIIPEILKKPRKSADRGLILGSTSNLSQRPQNMHLYQVSPILNVKFWK